MQHLLFELATVNKISLIIVIGEEIMFGQITKKIEIGMSIGNYYFTTI